MEAIIRCFMCCSSGSERQLGLPVRYSQWSSCLFKNLREIATVLRKKINRKRLLFNLFGRNTPFLQFCRQALRKVWYINSAQWQKNTNGADVAALIVSPPKSIVKEQREEMEEDSFHCFVNKGQRASADCRRRERQACFRKTAEDVLDA